MDVIDKLRRTFRVKKTPIEHSHDYESRVTGEKLTVKSVGRQVLIERHDSKAKDPHTSVPKETMRRALEHDIVVHHENCSECANVRQR